VIKVGISEVSITPTPGYPLGGYIERYLKNNRASGKLHDIYARGFYLSDDSSEYIIISAEVLLFDNSFVELARKRISADTGIPETNIMLSATHTHAAPETSLEIFLFRFFYNEEIIDLIKDYNRFLLERLVEVTQKAKHDAKESELLIGRTLLEGICTNRIDPNLEKDSEIVVIADSLMRGGLMSFTCHPTVLGADNTLYSGDFLSYAAERIKNCAKGFVPVFINGAAGDQSTRFVRKNQSVDEAKRLGYMLGDTFCKLLKNLEKIDVKEIRLINKEVELKRRNLEEEKFREKLEAHIAELGKMLEYEQDPGKKRKISQDLLTSKLLLETYEKFDAYLKRLPETLRVNVSILILDSVAIVFIPAELFCSFGLEIKRKSKYPYTIIAGYSNGYYGYIPKSETFKHLDYESLMSIFKADYGRVLVNEVIKFLT